MGAETSVWPSSKSTVRRPIIPSDLLSTSSYLRTAIRSISTTPPKTPPPEPFDTMPTRDHPPPCKSQPSTLPHLTPTSEIHVISTSAKSITHRRALAIGHVRFSNPEPLRLIKEHGLKKGDVLAVARVAGIQAVKITSTIIPLAHPGLPVEGCIIRVEPTNPESIHHHSEKSSHSEIEKRADARDLTKAIGPFGGVRISAEVETTAKTGVEMEALTGVMGAALTVVDMCKGVDKGCEICEVRVVGKRGGRSGSWGIWDEKESDVPA